MEVQEEESKRKREEEELAEMDKAEKTAAKKQERKKAKLSFLDDDNDEEDDGDLPSAFQRGAPAKFGEGASTSAKALDLAIRKNDEVATGASQATAGPGAAATALPHRHIH